MHILYGDAPVVLKVEHAEVESDYARERRAMLLQLRDEQQQMEKRLHNTDKLLHRVPSFSRTPKHIDCCFLEVLLTLFIVTAVFLCCYFISLDWLLAIQKVKVPKPV